MTAGEEPGGNATADYEKTGGYGERQQGGTSADSDRVRQEADDVESHRRPLGDTAGMHDAEDGADNAAS
jgi:hypothetical protein